MTTPRTPQPLRRRTARRTVAFLAFATCGIALPTHAGAVPSAITYTAYLQDPSGAASTAPSSVVAVLLDSPTGGTVITSTPGAVEFDDGLLQLTLEDVDASALAAGAWIELTIDGETFEPPQRIVAVPFALRAANTAFPVQPAPPDASSSGELWYNTASGKLMLHDGTTWVPVVNCYLKAEADAAFAPAALAGQVTALEAAGVALQNSASALADDVSTLDANFEAFESVLGDLQSAYEGFASADTNLGSRIDALEAGATSAGQVVSELDARVGQLESKSTDHGTSLANLAGDVGTLQNDVAAAASANAQQDARLTTLESSGVTTIELSDAIDSATQGLDTRLKDVESATAANSASLESLQAALACAGACAADESRTCVVHACDAGACTPTTTPLPDGAACVTRFGAGSCTGGACRWEGGSMGGAYGLGIKYESGRLSIACGGAACGPANPGYIVTSNAEGSGFVTARVDSTAHYFDDANAPDGTPSSLGGNPFGTTPGVSWPSTAPRPFFLYAVARPAETHEVAFFISPAPNLVAAPTSLAAIGYRNNPATDQQDASIFFLSGPEALTFAGQRAVLVGRFRMYKEPAKGVADNWWVVPPGPRDGLGAQWIPMSFTLPAGQAGAAPGQFLAKLGTSAGQPPTFSEQTVTYQIAPDGQCDLSVYLRLDGGADGLSSDYVGLSLPYRAAEPNSFGGSGRIFRAVNGVDRAWPFFFGFYEGIALARLMGGADSPNDAQAMRCDDFLDGSRSVVGTLRYKAF
ncbi:MAG: hypothetical protein R3F39_20180 [Myxococcota bacterium]